MAKRTRRQPRRVHGDNVVLRIRVEALATQVASLDLALRAMGKRLVERQDVIAMLQRHQHLADGTIAVPMEHLPIYELR